MTSAFPSPHLCKTLLKIPKPDFIINISILYQPITQPSLKGHLGVTAKTTVEFPVLHPKREGWSLKKVIQKVPSVHNLGCFAEGKNCEPSSGSPSANLFLTPIAGRSPLPVSDVPRDVTGTSAMNPPQVYCAQSHSWATLTKAFGVSTSGTLSHAQNITPTFPSLCFLENGIKTWHAGTCQICISTPLLWMKKRKRSFTTQHIWKVSRAQSRHLQMSPSVTLFIRGPSSSLG